VRSIHAGSKRPLGLVRPSVAAIRGGNSGRINARTIIAHVRSFRRREAI
jgi:hypothetical protein